MKLVHWSLMVGLLHLVQRGGTGAGPLLAVLNVTAHLSITVLLYYMIRCSAVLMYSLKGYIRFANCCTQCKLQSGNSHPLWEYILQ